ncbi:MAG: phosphoribosyltransferase [Thermoplasmata archaeon]|nr:phosphoribosyltransferase [Thermoplasmata archaeon]
MPDFPRCRRTGWDDADRWADFLAEQVTRAGRVPETLVALTRGGWVPARLLADRLGLKRIVSLRAQHWGVTATPSGKAELTEGLSGPVEGQTVLVVDDITDTGESLELATAHVASHGARRVESATCLHISHSRFVPTYHAETIDRDHWVWVVFPWNYWEDLQTLGRRAFEETHDFGAAAKLLQERCGFPTTPADVERALRTGARDP